MVESHFYYLGLHCLREGTVPFPTHIQGASRPKSGGLSPISLPLSFILQLQNPHGRAYSFHMSKFNSHCLSELQMQTKTCPSLTLGGISGFVQSWIKSCSCISYICRCFLHLSQACKAPEPLLNEPGPEKEVILKRKGKYGFWRDLMAHSST